MIEHMRVLPVDQLEPEFPRDVDEEKLDELVASIKSGDIIQPLLVRPKPEGGGYFIVCGYRRYLAAIKAGLSHVPCVVRHMSEEEAIVANLVENIQRQDMSDYEIAKMLKRLRDMGFSTRRIAEMVGKTCAWVTYHIKMLDVEEVVTRVTTQAKRLGAPSVPEPRKVMAKMTERHARVIRQAPEGIREALVQRVMHTVARGEELPTVKELESAVERMRRDVEVEEAKAPPQPPYAKLERWHSPAFIDLAELCLPGIVFKSESVEKARKHVIRFEDMLCTWLEATRAGDLPPKARLMEEFKKWVERSWSE